MKLNTFFQIKFKKNKKRIIIVEIKYRTTVCKLKDHVQVSTFTGTALEDLDLITEPIALYLILINVLRETPFFKR